MPSPPAATPTPTAQQIADYLAGLAAAPKVAAERKAAADRSLVVSPPSVGNQVIVDPIIFTGALRKGSTYIALILGVMQYLPVILPMFMPSLRGAFGPAGEVAANSPPWASAIVMLSSYARDMVAANGAAKVATAAVDPIGGAAAPDHGPVLTQIRDELRAMPRPAA